MLVKNELVGKIKDYFDLNIYETKVWLALLGKGSASAGEIASVSGVPRSRTYDVLESLEKKGFAIVKLGKPVKYLGVKPKIILEKLKNNVRVEADEKVKALGGLKETNEFQQLEELYNVGINPVKREDLSASIKGRSLITNHLREILDSATEEVIFCVSANEIKLKEKIYEELFSELKERGITVKVALSGEKEIVKELEKSLDTQVKHIEVKAKFFIVDRKEVLFHLSPESTKDDQAIWINSEFFSEGFADLFDIVTKD
ncbi:TrmB family transcriptional regulator [archaeon]|nr:TrmB family transcriptional regulator [archaeon]